MICILHGVFYVYKWTPLTVFLCCYYFIYHLICYANRRLPFDSSYAQFFFNTLQIPRASAPPDVNFYINIGIFASCTSVLNVKISCFLYLPRKGRDILLTVVLSQTVRSLDVTCIVGPSSYLTEDTVHCKYQRLNPYRTNVENRVST